MARQFAGDTDCPKARHFGSSFIHGCFLLATVPTPVRFIPYSRKAAVFFELLEMEMQMLRMPSQSTVRHGEPAEIR